MTDGIFVSSVQREFAEERRAIRAFVDGDALLRRCFTLFRLDRSVETVAGEVTREVTPEVRLIQLLVGSMTRRQLQEALGLKDDEHFRIGYLLPTLAAGLVEKTIADKPTSRLQKYRLTAKGRAVLASSSNKDAP